MAQISYEDVRANNDNEFDVGFFSLKADGDEAIVRILCDQVSDLEILTVHPVTVGNSSFPNRQVNCLRTPHDPLDACPFCNSGEKVRQRVFIKMLQYDPNTRKSSAVVWDRPAGAYVPKLKSYIDNYGPLSNIMCKIIRHGSGLDTTYDIIPNLNPQVFTLEAYPVDTTPFEEFKVLGRMVLDKSADDMIAYMRTGNFPETKSDTAATPTTPTYTPAPQMSPDINVNSFNNYNPNAGGMAPQPIPNGYNQPYEGGPAPMDAGSLQRPTRYY